MLFFAAMNKSSSQKELQIRSQTDPLLRVLELVKVLRGPEGCPWDQKQTLRAMTPYLQEEAFEVVEAVGESDSAGLKEELGDLLFLVLFLCELAEAEGRASISSASDAVVNKLISRHPHVFEETGAINAGDALKQWEEIKKEEKSGDREPASVLGDRPPGLPALTTAFRISEKAGAVGFEWPSVEQAMAKLEEEAGEFRTALEQDADPEKLEDELGDMLYSIANIARYLSIDPERALRGTIKKFTERFRYVEASLHEKGKTPGTSSLKEMDALWEEAKGQV